MQSCLLFHDALLCKWLVFNFVFLDAVNVPHSFIYVQINVKVSSVAAVLISLKPDPSATNIITGSHLTCVAIGLDLTKEIGTFLLGHTFIYYHNFGFIVASQCVIRCTNSNMSLV